MTREQTITEAANESLAEIATQRGNLRAVATLLGATSDLGIEVAMLDLKASLDDAMRRLDEQEARVRGVVRAMPVPTYTNARGVTFRPGNRVRFGTDEETVYTVVGFENGALDCTQESMAHGYLLNADKCRLV